MPRSPYRDFLERLTSTIHEPENEQACWLASFGGMKCKGGYVRLNVWVPGLGDYAKMSAHIALWVAIEAGVRKTDDIYLAYLEFRCSGLTLDHSCYQPSCRNPDHLEPVTMDVNLERRRYRPVAGYREPTISQHRSLDHEEESLPSFDRPAGRPPAAADADQGRGVCPF